MNRAEVRAWVEERRDQILDLLAEMIATDSVTGGELPLAELCAAWLREHGIEAILQPCLDRANVVSVVGSGEPTLLLAGHLDTVGPGDGAWTYGPWTPTIAEGRMYGLGASDMHASTVGAYFASLFLATRDLPGRLVTMFAIEEERSGAGSAEFVKWAREERFLDFSRTECVMAEPTDLKYVCLGNRCASFVRLTVEGIGGHGARPGQARNPLVKLNQILAGLADLQEQWRREHADPRFGRTTLTPTSLEGGSVERPNAIPVGAAALVDCRLTPALSADGRALFRSGVEKCLLGFEEKGFRIDWEERHVRAGHLLAEDHPLAELAMTVLRDDLGVADAHFHYTAAGNDSSCFDEAGIPIVNKLGPGNLESIHRADEFVEVESVLRGVELYIWLGLRYFGLS